MTMLNRLHLEIICAVQAEGSISKAADKLCLTQSALSHSIRKLERAFGIEVWARRGRKLYLTRAGALLLALAERVLPDIEQAEMLVKRLAGGHEGLLRIGMECHPCHEWLHRIIPGFIAAFDGVDIDVKRQFRFDGITALVNHDIDMLITPDPVFKAGLKFVPVFDYELVLVAALDHPLGNKRHVEPATLTDEVLYTYPVAKERLDLFSQFLMPAKLEPKEHKMLESTDIMLQMVAARRGVTALPSWLVGQYEKSLGLRHYKLGRKGVHKSLYLGLRAEDVGIPYLKGFIRLAKQAQVGRR